MSSQGPPSNSELTQRITRVEEKIDHQSETLDRIEQQLSDDHQDLTERLERMEPRHKRLWHTYQAGKWLIAVGSGGGVLAALLSGVVAAAV